jgi:glycosyltransferase involved in cell wall biosynthesis
MNVHQLLSGAGPHDAITTEARAFRSCFGAWGWGGGDHAFRMAPGLNGSISSSARLQAAPGDVLLLHHSAGWPRLHELMALPNPKLLLYHNITPASWLWEHAPILATQCAAGREQLPELVRSVEIAAADSAFNAAELASVGASSAEVIPLLIDPDRLGSPAGDPADPPTVLFVGRLSPHKRQDEAIRVFALYRRHRAPDAKLVLVGDPVTDAYAEQLRELGNALAPGAVRVESGLSAQTLGERYRAAHAFLCMSAHEGFCVPLLEAFHFGVPVVARPAGAVPEVAGNAALLVDDADPAVVAELLHLAITDRELRADLRCRGRERLAAYAPEVVASRLRHAVEATSAARSR